MARRLVINSYCKHIVPSGWLDGWLHDWLAAWLAGMLAGWPDGWLAGFTPPWSVRGWAPGGCRGHLQADGLRRLGGEHEEPAGPICERFADLGLQGERFGQFLKLNLRCLRVKRYVESRICQFIGGWVMHAGWKCELGGARGLQGGHWWGVLGTRRGWEGVGGWVDGCLAAWLAGCWLAGCLVMRRLVALPPGIYEFGVGCLAPVVHTTTSLATTTSVAPIILHVSNRMLKAQILKWVRFCFVLGKRCSYNRLIN